MMLRLGPYGDGFGANPDGLTLQATQGRPARRRLRAAASAPGRGAAHPVGQGRTRAGACWSPTPPGCARRCRRTRVADGYVLIGRRHLRSNNSWMHNLPALAGGTNRCTLQIHPDDAAELGLTDDARVKGPGGELVVPVELTDRIRRGVVSLPHGWGHDRRRHHAGGGDRATRGERQPAQRRDDARPAVGNRGAQRDPGPDLAAGGAERRQPSSQTDRHGEADGLLAGRQRHRLGRHVEADGRRRRRRSRRRSRRSTGPCRGPARTAPRTAGPGSWRRRRRGCGRP